MPIMFYYFIWILCVYHSPILRVSIFYFVNVRRALQQSLKLLITIILWVLLNIQRLGLSYSIYEQVLASNLCQIAY